MTTGFKDNNGTDLADIFQPLGNNAPYDGSTNLIAEDGRDLNQWFAGYISGTIYTSNYNVNSTNLGNIFQYDILGLQSVVFNNTSSLNMTPKINADGSYTTLIFQNQNNVPQSGTTAAATGYFSFNGASTLTVGLLVIGGGGGGGAGYISGSNYGGGGGGGGAGIIYTSIDINSNTDYNITVGGGGAGKYSTGYTPNQGGATGYNGGESKFELSNTMIYYGYGGGGGKGYGSAQGYTGGAAGNAVAPLSTTGGGGGGGGGGGNTSSFKGADVNNAWPLNGYLNGSGYVGSPNYGYTSGYNPGNKGSNGAGNGGNGSGGASYTGGQGFDRSSTSGIIIYGGNGGEGGDTSAGGKAGRSSGGSGGNGYSPNGESATYGSGNTYYYGNGGGGSKYYSGGNGGHGVVMLFIST